VVNGRRRKMKAVYSPCVDPLEYMYNSKKKSLPPREMVVLDDAEARYLIRKFEKFGVRFLKTVKKGNKLVADEGAFKAAGEQWEKGNKAWAEETVTDFHKATKDQREAGVKVDEPVRVQVAKKILKIAVIACALLLPAASWAQDTGQHKAANFTYKYDVASATITYCATEGANGDPFAQPYDGPGQIETVGDSVTITGANLAEDVFLGVDLGDVIFIRRQNGTTEDRVVVTNADNDTITVDTSIDLSSGVVWSYRKLICGTTVNDGWINTAGYSIVQMGIQYDAGDVTTLAATMECKGGGLGAAPNRVYPGISSDCGDGTLVGTTCEFANTGDVLSFKIAHNAFTACRIGVAWVTADGGTRDEITALIDVGR